MDHQQEGDQAQQFEEHEQRQQAAGQHDAEVGAKRDQARRMIAPPRRARLEVVERVKRRAEPQEGAEQREHRSEGIHRKVQPAEQQRQVGCDPAQCQHLPQQRRGPEQRDSGNHREPGVEQPR
jgi:hypothetical protein